MEDLKSVKIKKEIHKKLKIYCIENELKINSILEKLILDFLKNKSDKNVNN